MTTGVMRKYVEAGECTINVPTTIKRWNKDWSISQWDDEYTLCHDNPESDNFTRTDFKARITKRQAIQLIVELNLTQIQSPVFRSGKTWRKIEQN